MAKHRLEDKLEKAAKTETKSIGQTPPEKGSARAAVAPGGPIPRTGRG